jgi:hypothetical protein
MMGPARDCLTRTPWFTQVQGPPPLLPALFLIIFTVVTMLLELFGLEEEEEGSDLPSLRVQTPLYRRGSGYRLGG